jgi:thioredoxin reductase (NADPH)
VFDIAIIGAGPAGISAALTAHARGKDVMLVSNDPLDSGLAKAERINNYPGLVGKSGAEVLQIMLDDLKDVSLGVRAGRVTSILPFGEEFLIGVGQDMEQSSTVILATGAVKDAALPGEERLLGHGVSYCATCDGMLYKDRPVCVVGTGTDAEKEAAFLADIGCTVTYVSPTQPTGLAEGITFLPGKKLEVLGEESVESLLVDGEKIPCEAVFVLRPAIAPTSLMADLETDGAFIKVDEKMRTNIPGVFAAGDCTGTPLQVAKAVGEGQIAAFSAVGYLDAREK